MKRQGILLVCVWLVSFSLQANGVYNVRDYGAKGDGKTLDHIAINKAIEAATANGGGQVVLSSGTYLCGSIRLKSNVDLHLMPGAKILAAPALMKAYDESESFGGFPEYQDGGHTYFHNSLIWADEQQNISITGRGMIDGEGLTTRDTETAGNPQGGSIGTGDKAIALKLCRNVTIRDITIYCGGHFAIIATGCDIGTIDNVTIDTNRDGIDIDCCKYFTVSNTKVNTPNDDAIVLKSSYALKRPVLCEHILITNCIVTGYKLGSLLNGKYIPEKVNWVCGRIKLGTESNGGYRNITISNCTCMWSSGLAFEEVDQGRMENIMVSNISLSHVHHYPIYITTGCRNRGPKEVTRLSSARDIYINNVVADDCDSLAGIIITGMEGEPIRNVSLSNIRIQYRGGAKKVTTPYREQGTNYPEPRWAGPTPAYGLFARHVDGLHLQNVKFELMRPDERPDIILENVRNYSAMPKVQLQDEVLQTAQKANDYFMAKNSDPTQPTNVNKLRPSSLWTRAVYYEGLMALNTIDPQQRYIDYAMRWADFHQWTPRNGVNTCDADDQCCGQTYVELLPYTGKDYKELLVNVIANLDHQMLTPNTIIQGSASHAHTHINSLYGWWTWIDAIQMAMPLYMQVSKLTGNTKYRDHALKMYLWTRNKCGGGC